MLWASVSPALLEDTTLAGRATFEVSIPAEGGITE